MMKKDKKAMYIISKTVHAKESTLVIILAFFIILFWSINHNYLSQNNIRMIFNSAFVTGTLAAGLSCLLISGKIDLSCGNTGMMGGIIIAFLLLAGMPWVPALLITLVFGAVTGLVNAFFINVMNFAPFISTLAVSSIYAGLSLVVTNSQNILIGNKSFLRLGTTNLGVFPLIFIVTIVLLIVYGSILYTTGFGRRVLMVGGNQNAARLAGINPKKITTVLFVNNSVVASLAGALFASLIQMGSPSAVTGADLDAITAIVLGGVTFTGGSGNMFGVFIGVLLITSFQNGLLAVGFRPYYQVVAKGLLLIGALILDYYRENARIKSINAISAD